MPAPASGSDAAAPKRRGKGKGRGAPAGKGRGGGRGGASDEDWRQPSVQSLDTAATPPPPRSSDWECPKCKASVFVSKSACYKCRTPRLSSDSKPPATARGRGRAPKPHAAPAKASSTRYDQHQMTAVYRSMLVDDGERYEGPYIRFVRGGVQEDDDDDAEQREQQQQQLAVAAAADDVAALAISDDAPAAAASTSPEPASGEATEAASPEAEASGEDAEAAAVAAPPPPAATADPASGPPLGPCTRAPSTMACCALAPTADYNEPDAVVGRSELLDEETATRAAGVALHAGSSSGFGMLLRMGWREGGGLGRCGQVRYHDHALMGDIPRLSHWCAPFPPPPTPRRGRSCRRPSASRRRRSRTSRAWGSAAAARAAPAASGAVA